MKRDIKKRTKAEAALAVGGRCPTCGAQRNKKDTTCMRCALNAKNARRFASPDPIPGARKKK